MELSTRYDARATEAKWYPVWETSGYFHAEGESPRPSYCIVIPPPNITGILHMGHALNNTLQDVLIRWHRMAGFNTLWVPGTDHASIATQYVVERKLRDEGMERPRETLGREKFLEKVWDWKEQYGGTIVRQLKRMGCSCDWQRERFTMDEGLSRAVRTVFFRLYHEGLIYRGNYLVNWCPRCMTTLADDEVDYADKAGKLWYLKYPVVGEPGRFAVVATTRPETMLGDSAVAVNPTDERYRDLIGKQVELPLTGRTIPVIADDFVDKEFGTGMVKITPAHDPNDWQAGKRHNLPEINIFTPDAKVNENGGSYAGLDRYAARKKVLEDLEAQGLLLKTAEHPQRVGTCYRCNTVIEPYLSLQWFVKMDPLVRPAIEAVNAGKLTFHPEARKADMLRWLDTIRDWAISRQLWWGHQIPAFYAADGSVVVPKSEEEYETMRREAAEGKNGLRQDDDVLDTWFSSALWPFSTLGWPDDTPELKTFYPTSVLSTGKDIIFFWVARMLMMGIHFLDEVPFKDVFFHPIVADEHGKKMSKSKGNAIDPLDLIEEFGTDALRIALASYSAREQHIAFSVKELEGYRNFMNKLWNASRLILTNVQDLRHQNITAAGPLSAAEREAVPLEDRWILSRYARCVRTMNEALAAFDFDIAVKAFREFFWNDFCDYYLELVKPRLYQNPQDESATPEAIKSRAAAQGLLVLILEGSMRLLHPICPFVTEEIWQAVRSLVPEEVRLSAPSGALTPRVAPAPVALPADAPVNLGDASVELQSVSNHVATVPQDSAVPGAAGLGDMADGGPVQGYGTVPPATVQSEGTLGGRTIDALGSQSVMIAPWNDFAPDTLIDEAAEREIGFLQEVLYAIRNIRGEMKLPPSVAAALTLATPDAARRALLERQSSFFTTLTNVKSLAVEEKAEAPAFAATAIAEGVVVFVELPEEMRGQEIERLERELTRLTGDRDRLEAKLGNESFTAKAPAAVVEKERSKLSSLDQERRELEEKLRQLRG